MLAGHLHQPVFSKCAASTTPLAVSAATASIPRPSWDIAAVFGCARFHSQRFAIAIALAMQRSDGWVAKRSPELRHGAGETRTTLVDRQRPRAQTPVNETPASASKILPRSRRSLSADAPRLRRCGASFCVLRWTPFGCSPAHGRRQLQKGMVREQMARPRDDAVPTTLTVQTEEPTAPRQA